MSESGYTQLKIHPARSSTPGSRGSRAGRRVGASCVHSTYRPRLQAMHGAAARPYHHAVAPAVGRAMGAGFKFIGRMTAGSRVHGCRLAAPMRELKVRPYPLERGRRAFLYREGSVSGTEATRAGGDLTNRLHVHETEWLGIGAVGGAVVERTLAALAGWAAGRCWLVGGGEGSPWRCAFLWRSVPEDSLL